MALQWWQSGLGPLDYPRTMRLAIPGATLTALGLQTVLGSFFGSILGCGGGDGRASLHDPSSTRDACA